MWAFLSIIIIIICLLSSLVFEGARALLPSAFAQYSCSRAIHLGQLSTNCFPIILESTQKARVSISSCFRALLWLVRKTKLVIESSFEELSKRQKTFYCRLELEVFQHQQNRWKVQKFEGRRIFSSVFGC